MNKRVLVIVVTYNGMRWLERCLASVCAVGGSNGIPLTANKAQNAPGGQISEPLTAVSVGLYVWDNDSTDGSADFVAGHYPAATLVRSAENLGFSRPNNLGVEYAIKNGYDYVYFLNQDAWLDPGALQKMLAASEAHPDYAVLSPLQMTDGYQALDHNFAQCLPSCTKTAEFVHQTAENGVSCTKMADFVPQPAENGVSCTKTAEFVHQPAKNGVSCTKTAEFVHQTAENGVSCTKMADFVHQPAKNGVSCTKMAEFVPQPAKNGVSCTKMADFVHQPAENGNWSVEIPAVIEVKRIMAAHWLVPVWAWERVGAFNEELFPLYGQDDDWCNRARQCGLKIGVVLAARAVHDRAYRKEGVERLVSRNYYTGSLVRLANPNRALWLTWPYVFLFTLVKAVKYRSILPFKYLRTILKQIPAVKASRMHEVHAR